MRQVEDFDNRREEPQSQTAHTDPPRYRLLEWFLCAQLASVSRRTIPKRAFIQFAARLWLLRRKAPSRCFSFGGTGHLFVAARHR